MLIIKMILTPIVVALSMWLLCGSIASFTHWKNMYDVSLWWNSSRVLFAIVTLAVSVASCITIKYYHRGE